MQFATAGVDWAADGAVSGIHHDNQFVIQQRPKTSSKLALSPRDVAVGALVGLVRMDRDRVEPAQRPFAAIDERPREQLTFVLERDFVGALRRAEHRDDDADDGNGHDNADRHHDAAAIVVAAVCVPLFVDGRRSHGQVSSPKGFFAPKL